MARNVLLYKYVKELLSDLVISSAHDHKSLTIYDVRSIFKRLFCVTALILHMFNISYINNSF